MYNSIAHPAMQQDAKKIILVAIGFALAGIAAIATVAMMPEVPLFNGNTQAALPMMSGSLIYSFNSPGILQEAGSMQQSTSPYWWLNSGGEFIITNGVGETMQGVAPLLNKWRVAYALSNPVDTDNGTHPQNLFRLVSKGQWENLSAEAHFYIVADNLSSSSNRNQSNGLLLMS
ncbi:MAG TPA: hypothetical protein VN495_02245, partial [Candidatus Paceibacterota bacterium]|nr:hypothetical protein [Candidatus Paceibacterota bacterium]